ncbi:13353_t:CDS:2 [Rhizophagus irregularis]|nr:13353_t:CDS:2 [Rhizophagus irregularis]
MFERPLNELWENLVDSPNDDGWDILLERCLTAPKLDLDKFLGELSHSFDTYIPTLQIFILHLYNKYLRVTLSLNLMNTSLDKFISMLLTDVIANNLQNSDIPGFGEFFHNCIELLWWNSNKDNNMLTVKHILSTILDADGVFGVLISENYGHRCLKRILFDFKIIIHIEQEKLYKALGVVSALEKCSEHKNVSSRLSKSFSVYKSCNTLLQILECQGVKQVNEKDSSQPILDDMVRFNNKNSKKQHWNRKRDVSNIPNNSTFLSTECEQYLNLLKMPAPKKPSDLPNFLEALEQRKINSFQVLIDLLQCASCHKQALTHFSRDKYFLELEEEPSSSDCLYSLPFEFNDYDNLGPWDILLSEDTIKDLRQLESSPEMIRTVIKKLGQLSLGKWDKHELRRKVQTHAIPVYEIELPDNDSLKILWQVDYGFSIRSKTFTQLVKIWAVTANKEQIHKRLENLLIVHQFYTPKHLCVTRQADKDNVISPKTLGNEEMGSPENGLHSNSLMDERLLGVHNMLVTNKFVTFSWNLYKSIVLGGLNFTFQVSQKEYDIINNPTSAIIIGRSGTGKTTCIVFRQIASYLNSQLFARVCDACRKRDFNNAIK